MKGLTTSVLLLVATAAYAQDDQITDDEEILNQLCSFTNCDLGVKKYSMGPLGAKVSWLEAKRRCEEEGKQMASISSPEEQLALEILIKTRPYNHYWTGGSRRDDGVTWRWPSGQVIGPYRKWLRGEPSYRLPDYDCQVVHSDYLSWCVHSCALTINYVCEYY